MRGDILRPPEGRANGEVRLLKSPRLLVQYTPLPDGTVRVTLHAPSWATLVSATGFDRYDAFWNACRALGLPGLLAAP